MTWLYVAAAVLILLGLLLRRQYGNIGKRIGAGVDRLLGPGWARRLVVGLMVATTAVWIAVWALVSPETRERLTLEFFENPPWAQWWPEETEGESSVRPPEPPRHSVTFSPVSSK